MTRRTLSLSPERYAQLQARRGKRNDGWGAGIASRPEVRAEQQATNAKMRAALDFNPKLSKHRAVKTVVDGLTFDSKLEARVWGELKLRQFAGEIRKLRRQVRFSLFAPGGEHLGTYAADFVFDEIEYVPNSPDNSDWHSRWHRVVADAKSPHTRKLPGWSKIKRLMMACHSIAVLELP